MGSYPWEISDFERSLMGSFFPNLDEFIKTISATGSSAGDKQQLAAHAWPPHPSNKSINYT